MSRGILSLMIEPHERLGEARRAAGYATATDAAQAMGVPAPGYIHHENGTRGLGRQAERYARFFRVSLEWLLTGRGEMRPRPRRHLIPVLGKVGAGAQVYMPDDLANEPLDEIELDFDGDFALQVEGDSQYPRFCHGEWLICGGEPVPPERLIGRYAVVQCENDGRRLVKMIERGARPGAYDLVSHNAPVMRGVTLIGAWRIKCPWFG